MAGHWWSKLACALFGHQERLWVVTAAGGGWSCVRCLHFQPSRGVKHRPRLITPTTPKRPTGADTPAGPVHATRSRRTAQP